MTRNRHARHFSQFAFPEMLAHYGEPIAYFFASGGDPVSTVAIVDQEPPQRYDQSGNVWQPIAEIQLREGKDGIFTRLIDTGGDYVDLVDYRDEVPRYMSVVQVISFDSGVIHLALR